MNLGFNTTFVRQTIGIGYGVLCFILYYSGIYYIVEYFKRHTPVILMYHSVNSHDFPYIYRDNIVGVENFERQMVYLSSKKRIISLSELAKYLENNTQFPSHVAVITFDDGYYDFYTNAHPVLKKHKISSTVFPITKFLDTGELKWEDMLTYLVNATKVESLSLYAKGKVTNYNLTSPSHKLSCIRKMNSILLKMNEFERAACFSKIKEQLNVSSKPSDHVMLGWNEIQELQKEGFVSFGSHTHSHVDLAVLNPKMAELEISQSKQEIENFLSIPCTLFSYPFGKRHNFNQGIKNNLRDMGFSIAVTTIRGNVSKGSDPFELKRIAAIDDSSYRFKCSLIGIALQRR